MTYKQIINALIALGIPEHAPDIAKLDNGDIVFAIGNRAFVYDGRSVSTAPHGHPLVASVLVPYEDPHDADTVLMARTRQVRCGWLMRRMGYDEYGAPMVFGLTGAALMELVPAWQERHGDTPMPTPSATNGRYLVWQGQDAPTLWALAEEVLVASEDYEATAVEKDEYYWSDEAFIIHDSGTILHAPDFFRIGEPYLECIDERALIAILAMHHAAKLSVLKHGVSVTTNRTWPDYIVKILT